MSQESEKKMKQFTTAAGKNPTTSSSIRFEHMLRKKQRERGRTIAFVNNLSASKSYLCSVMRHDILWRLRPQQVVSLRRRLARYEPDDDDAKRNDDDEDLD